MNVACVCLWVRASVYSPTGVCYSLNVLLLGYTFAANKKDRSDHIIMVNIIENVRKLSFARASSGIIRLNIGRCVFTQDDLSNMAMLLWDALHVPEIMKDVYNDGSEQGGHGLENSLSFRWVRMGRKAS